MKAWDVVLVVLMRIQGREAATTVERKPAIVTSAKLLRANGHSIHTIAKQLHIGVGTTQKILAAAVAA